MRLILVDERTMGEILNQGLPHEDVTGEVKELIELLGSGHIDAAGAVGIAEQLRKLLRL